MCSEQMFETYYEKFIILEIKLLTVISYFYLHNGIHLILEFRNVYFYVFFVMFYNKNEGKRVVQSCIW